MREKSLHDELTFALTADVAEAHRQIPIAPCDWHLLGCQVEKGEQSMSIPWARLGLLQPHTTGHAPPQHLGGLHSTAQHTQPAPGTSSSRTTSTWRLGGPQYRPALLVFFVLCAVTGFPLSWNKTAGGDLVTGVGFELLHQTHQLGISARRAEWFVKWSRDMASKRVVHMHSFEEGLGRITYVAGALEHVRPFLAPLYRFLAIHPRSSVRVIPPYVTFFLRYVAQQVEAGRHFPCALDLRASSQAPRVDAQASSERTGIGGWLPVVRRDGSIDKWASSWFSHEVKEEVWPWLFEKRGSAALVISTFEALAVLISLKAFYGDESPQYQRKVVVAPTWTDNRGNGAALNKLMSTKFPSSAVLMELAAHLRKTGIKAEVHWAPRTANREADALANGEVAGFNPERRISIEPDRLSWCVLPEVLALGRQSMEEYEAFKNSGENPGRCRKEKRRRAEDRLKVTDPW